MFGCEDEGDVVFVIVGREVEGIFCWVVDEIYVCLVYVGVFCCLWFLYGLVCYDLEFVGWRGIDNVYCVVMILYYFVWLLIWEVIVFVFFRGGGVFGLIIKGSVRIGFVEVNGVVGVGVVDEVNDGFGFLWYYDGGIGRDVIVVDKIGGIEVWVDGVLEGFDFNFVVMYKFGNCGVGIGKVWEWGGYVG